jgi:DNA-binding CsgD family transcriptional regulator
MHTREASAPAPPAAPDWALLAIDRLAQGVALLNPSCTVYFANAAARNAVARAGWSLGDKRLHCPVAADRRAWTDALLQVCVQGKHRLLELKTAGGSSSICVSLAPLQVGDQSLAVATFEREDLCGPLELQLFSASHGLTLAENQVLQRLCQGQRPAQIAREHGVAHTTVLTQVAAIRIKTRRSSVQALLHKLSRLPHAAGPQTEAA